MYVGLPKHIKIENMDFLLESLVCWYRYNLIWWTDDTQYKSSSSIYSRVGSFKFNLFKGWFILGHIGSCSVEISRWCRIKGAVLWASYWTKGLFCRYHSGIWCNRSLAISGERCPTLVGLSRVFNSTHKNFFTRWVQKLLPLWTVIQGYI